MKIIPPRSMADKPTGRFSKAQMQREMARQAVIDRELARYIMMECGHATDHETQRQYSVFRSKKHKLDIYCETCGEWRKADRPSPKPRYPDTPLF